MKICFLALLSIISTFSFAEENSEYAYSEQNHADSEEEFEGFYGDADFVSIATGSKKTLAKAPSVASVITAKQIKQMGARTLVEVLESVPGLHAAYSSEIYGPKFLLRGISSNFNPQTLVQIDGTPITSVFRGDRQVVWGGFPLNSISRIEIIRGPGSALHGSDAFAGVVNIITKGFDEMQSTEIGFRTGSFDTKESWFNTSFVIGDLEIGLSAEYIDTDGHDGIIAADAQTFWDAYGDSLNLDAPHVSLAPGKVNTGYRGYDVRTDINYGDLSIRFGYVNRENVGTGQGGAKALDPIGKLGSDKVLLNIGYHKHLNENWNSEYKLSHYRSSQIIEEYLILFPKGAFFGAFPDGFSGNPETFEKTTIGQARYTYDGFDKQFVTFGLGYKSENLYKVKERKNFEGLNSLPDLVDVSDTPDVFVPEAERHSKFAYIQDEYQLAADWELTLGLRFDQYSDFGNTVNPRIALVWATNRNLSTKFLYGRAFRAPAFVETKSRNNPVTLGNPNLKPETIDTFETAFNYQLTTDIHLDLNIYYLVINDYIDFFPDEGAPTITAQNGNKYKGAGLETELNYKISDQFTLLVNYAYQQLKNNVSDNDIGGAPNHQLFSQLNWIINDSYSLNVKASHIGSTKRNQFDSRSDLESYNKVDLHFEIKGILEDFDLHVIGSNIFDEDIFEPSPGPTTNMGTIDIPKDLPQAGIGWYVGLSTQF